MSSKISKGDFRITADQYKSHSGVMTITEINEDKAQPGGHYQIILKRYPNHATESTRNETEQYFADHVAFPVTYIKSTYEGNKKLQDNVGYVIREGRSVGNERMVVKDNYIFLLHKWQDKDNYEVRYVLSTGDPASQGDNKGKSKKKKKGLFKSFKEKMKNASAGGVSIEKLTAEVLQPYLDEATAKQKAFYADWIKDPNNKNTVKYMDDKREMMNKAMKQYNDDIFNSPEYQRMLAYHRWLKSNVNLTVKNNSGSTLWVGSSKEAFITTKIEPGDEVTMNCTTDLYYYHSDAQGASGTKINQADGACGSVVNIN
ncbi:hypothetical protein [Nonlabens xiamenensis]|uniref:hypothetical protein n=1 Tax=Nonlabens xiamenensis TaxID=2341043 RepID=UPI000F60C1EB|nr:hypothetical protein [Nonlabens xiamenensis]